jgi:hypothetical protein
MWGNWARSRFALRASKKLQGSHSVSSNMIILGTRRGCLSRISLGTGDGESWQNTQTHEPHTEYTTWEVPVVVCEDGRHVELLCALPRRNIVHNHGRGQGLQVHVKVPSREVRLCWLIIQHGKSVICMTTNIMAPKSTHARPWSYLAFTELHME